MDMDQHNIIDDVEWHYWGIYLDILKVYSA